MLFIAMAAAVLFFVSPAFAETIHPTRTIKFIVGYAAAAAPISGAAGGAEDARELRPERDCRDRPGGNGMLGPDIAAKSVPDGYTLLFAATGQMAVSPAVYPKIPYQPLKDFVPVFMMTSYPLIMIVNGKHPATTLKDFIAGRSRCGQDQLREHVGSVYADIGAVQAQDRPPGQVIPFKSSNDSGDERGEQPGDLCDRRPPPIVPQITSGNARALGVASPVRLVELPMWRRPWRRAASI